MNARGIFMEKEKFRKESQNGDSSLCLLMVCTVDWWVDVAAGGKAISPASLQPTAEYSNQPIKNPRSGTKLWQIMALEREERIQALLHTLSSSTQVLRQNKRPMVLKMVCWNRNKYDVYIICRSWTEKRSFPGYRCHVRTAYAWRVHTAGIDQPETRRRGSRFLYGWNVRLIRKEAILTAALRVLHCAFDAQRWMQLARRRALWR